MAFSRRILLLLVTLFTLLLLASAVKLPQKSFVISFPENTPANILQQAKDAIISAGGIVTHEYTLFKGFAATAPEKVFDTLKTLAAQYVPTIEEDQIVTIQE